MLCNLGYGPLLQLRSNRATLDIDGSYGEGGGQLLRSAVALAAVTGRDTIVHSIRAKRRPPGLAPQHLAAVAAVAQLSNATVEGLSLRSQRIRFIPGNAISERIQCDVGTAGSITLVIQALLPPMVMSQHTINARIIGGTDVRQAPPIDYFAHVLLPLLAKLGVGARIEVVKRGYYPRGGGEVHLEVFPCTLRPYSFDERGELVRIDGRVHVSNLPEHIAARMRNAFVTRMSSIRSAPLDLPVSVLDDSRATGTGGAIVVWAQSQHSLLGAARCAERGVPAESLGSAVAEELTADLASGATLDQHASDQVLVFLALAGGGSFCTRAISSHARTAMWLIEQFLPVRFDIERKGDGFRVEVLRA